MQMPALPIPQGVPADIALLLEQSQEIPVKMRATTSPQTQGSTQTQGSPQTVRTSRSSPSINDQSSPKDRSATTGRSKSPRRKEEDNTIVKVSPRSKNKDEIVRPGSPSLIGSGKKKDKDKDEKGLSKSGKASPSTTRREQEKEKESSENLKTTPTRETTSLRFDSIALSENKRSTQTLEPLKSNRLSKGEEQNRSFSFTRRRSKSHPKRLEIASRMETPESHVAKMLETSQILDEFNKCYHQVINWEKQTQNPVAEQLENSARALDSMSEDCCLYFPEWSTFLARNSKA